MIYQNSSPQVAIIEHWLSTVAVTLIGYIKITGELVLTILIKMETHLDIN